MHEDLTVVIVDGGGRGHAISEAWESHPEVKRIIVTPGNDGIAYNRQKEVVIDRRGNLKDADSILEVARRHIGLRERHLVDVAQDDAIAAGTVNKLRAAGYNAFGPTAEQAWIESHKGHSRDFMERHGIPHPDYRIFDSEDDAIAYVRRVYEKNPKKAMYVKASGLAQGKGALMAESFDQAIGRIYAMKSFGASGHNFVIEDALFGGEFSAFALVNGQDYVLLGNAQDNKLSEDGDKGQQTGGMGGNSPAMVTMGIEDAVDRELFRKAIEGMWGEGYSYEGILYVGGIRVGDDPWNIEYNARWGDPEAQLVLPSLRNYPHMVLDSMNGKLKGAAVLKDGKARVGVVGVSKGYPGDYSAVRGKEIYGIKEVAEMPNIRFYSAGISMHDGRFYADGGRLFMVVGEGNNIPEARDRAYDAMNYISIEGGDLHYRRDMGRRDAERFLGILV